MKVYKYGLLQVTNEKDYDFNGSIVNYRDKPVQIGDEFILLINSEVTIPGMSWKELHELNCVVVKSEDDSEYTICPYDLRVTSLDKTFNGLTVSAEWAQVRLLTDEPHEINLDEFFPVSEWDDNDCLNGVQLKEGDNIDVLIHEEHKEHTEYETTYAILNGRIISWSIQSDGTRELHLLVTLADEDEFHSFDNILNSQDFLIRISKD